MPTDICAIAAFPRAKENYRSLWHHSHRNLVCGGILSGYSRVLIQASSIYILDRLFSWAWNLRPYDSKNYSLYCRLMTVKTIVFTVIMHYFVKSVKTIHSLHWFDKIMHDANGRWLVEGYICEEAWRIQIEDWRLNEKFIHSSADFGLKIVGGMIRKKISLTKRSVRYSSSKVCHKSWLWRYKSVFGFQICEIGEIIIKLYRLTSKIGW